MSKGPFVLITGCSEGGIGWGLADAFASRGFTVYATARDTSKVGEALTAKSNVQVLELDVTKPEHIQRVLETIQNNGAGLDYLINNAGRNHFMPLLDQDLEVGKQIFETNYWGPVSIMKAFAPLLIQSKGHITSITSIAGYLDQPYLGVYAGSKRALEIATEVLRLELEPFGVGVLSVVTGAVQSNGQTYFGDLALPENSLYKPIEKAFVLKAQGFDGYQRMPLKDFSSNVVDQICKRAVGRYWDGVAATVTKWGVTLLPSGLIDWGRKHGHGLEDLAKHAASSSSSSSPSTTP